MTLHGLRSCAKRTFSVRRSTFTVHRLAFAVRRSTFAVMVHAAAVGRGSTRAVARDLIIARDLGARPSAISLVGSVGIVSSLGLLPFRRHVPRLGRSLALPEPWRVTQVGEASRFALSELSKPGRSAYVVPLGLPSSGG